MENSTKMTWRAYQPDPIKPPSIKDIKHLKLNCNYKDYLIQSTRSRAAENERAKPRDDDNILYLSSTQAAGK